MPRSFPKGVWRVTGVEETAERDFAPVKIRTDARQVVRVWALDARGGYDRATGETAEDEGYCLHWSEYSRTTLGCGRVGADTDEQVRLLARMIREAWAAGDTVTLEVA
jgi:hypothetical protein